MVVLAINVGESGPTVAKYIEDQGYQMTVVLDPKAKLSQKYLVSGIPTTYFIAEDGTNLGAYQGPLNESTMAMYIEAISENRD